MQLVVGHPYLVLLASGLLERVGAPLLFSPVLVAAGALAAGGQLRFDVAVWIALATCLVGDTLWYRLAEKRVIAYFPCFAAFRWSQIAACAGPKFSSKKAPTA